MKTSDEERDHAESLARANCRAGIDTLFMEHGYEIVLSEMAEWLKTADLSASGHTARQIADVLGVMAKWEW